MSVLKDGEIRFAIAKYLNSRSPRPAAVIHELRVSRGNAIADLVALYKVPHCFEIKGHTDSVRRVLRQAEFYNRAFKRLTLVTTVNHEAWALLHLPEFWGLIVVHARDSSVLIRHVRPAKLNPQFDAITSLAPLWRGELVSIVESLSPGWSRASDSRYDLASKICAVSTSEAVLKFLVCALASRKATQPS